MIKTIVIHEKLIQQFKKEALLVYPKETIMGILGKQVEDILYIHCLPELNITAQKTNKKYIIVEYDQPEEDIEYSGLFYFGTIHSHPGETLCASDVDEKGFYESINEDDLPDKVMGIMRVDCLPKVNRWGVIFYNEAMEICEVLISEGKR